MLTLLLNALGVCLCYGVPLLKKRKNKQATPNKAAKRRAIRDTPRRDRNMKEAMLYSRYRKLKKGVASQEPSTTEKSVFDLKSALSVFSILSEGAKSKTSTVASSKKIPTIEEEEGEEEL
ncbi:hypothetical protein RRG08_053077 [Elysia crispata]|uniref:Uncharacterized protein n=1 Tax=Elysia crispata TaxID=231223 RepID=A0AAE1AXV3_9GAST|nr:hypothetical protein RRG08_053077 [Elysia crispata]